MTQKQKLYAAVITGVIVLLAAGGGVWWWLVHKTDNSTTNAHADSQPASQAVPLGQDSSSGSGLSVNSATSLGQLGQNSAGSGQGSTGASASGADPSSFAQYDKYKDGTGAMYAEISEGNGVQLKGGMKAALYYTGYLTNGQVFDSTNHSGQQQPFLVTLGANEVIPGFEQGIAGMKVGGKRLVIIPPAVGYGSQAQGSIPANSVLVFEVELISAQ